MNKLTVFTAFLLLYTCSVFAQTINVDATNVIKTFAHNPAAINLNYLTDDDSYLNPTVPMSQSLSNMNVGMLRFPGGEKADNYMWSAPPYAAANPSFATKGNCNWPNNDSRFSSNYINPSSTTLDFDEFMTMCNTVGAEALIVVAADAHYNTWCVTPPTLNDLITNAVEWVRYANVTNQYDIKYWMIGNESWNKAAYDNPSTAAQYASDLIQFSDAMKAIDPTIKIVANSKSGNWANTLIQQASAKVDVIAVSNYPNYNWTSGYDTYRNGNPNFVGEINSIISSIGSQNISVIVSEYNSIDWSGNWPSNNDLGHALVNFQMLGDQISIEEVDDAYLWNTRWVDNTSPQHLYDATDIDGNLNATGKALAMWGNNVLDKLVYSTNSGYVNSFATLDDTGENLNIFLINRDYSTHSTNINVSGYSAISAPDLLVTQSKMTGIAVNDKFPTITYPSNGVTINGAQISLQLDPLSIHVIQLKSAAVLPVTYQDFSGKYVQKVVELNWITTEEENNLGFEVERKSESEEWKMIDFVPSTAQDLNSSRYTFYDKEIESETYFYRLKQKDADGQNYQYSKVIQVKTGTDFKKVNCYPNPMKNQFFLSSEYPIADLSLKIFDLNGKEVFELAACTDVIRPNILAGIYVAAFYYQGKIVERTRLVKE